LEEKERKVKNIKKNSRLIHYIGLKKVIYTKLKERTIVNNRKDKNLIRIIQSVHGI